MSDTSRFHLGIETSTWAAGQMELAAQPRGWNMEDRHMMHILWLNQN